jgi:hypothetical protein
MKTIRLNDEELEYMISSYQVELSYAQDEVEHIKEVLRKIQSAKKAKSEKVIAAVAKKQGRKPKVTVFEKVESLVAAKPVVKAGPKGKKQIKGKSV